MSKSRHVLPSAAWVDGGNIQIPLKDIPPLSRVKAFVFRLEGVFTTGAAAAVIAGSQLFRLISMIDVGEGTRASGPFWHFMEWMKRGGECFLPASLPATNATAFRRHVTWTVPYRDPRAWAPADCEIVGASFAEKVLSIDTAGFAGLDGGTNTWNTLASITGTLRCEALLDEPNDSPGAIVQFRHADLTGQAPTVDGERVITDAFVYRENMATISSVQIATCAIQVDGVQRNDIVRLSEYTRAFNDAWSKGTDQLTDSATAPVSGEFLPETPANTGGVADTVTTPFLPLVFPDAAYKLTQCLRAENSVRFDFTGTDTTFRVGFRSVKARGEAAIVKQFHDMGRYDVASASDFAAKTESKKTLSGVKGHWARFFPARGIRSR
jgi:hypothetical protein